MSIDSEQASARLFLESITALMVKQPTGLQFEEGLKLDAEKAFQSAVDEGYQALDDGDRDAIARATFKIGKVLAECGVHEKALSCFRIAQMTAKC